MTDRTLNWSQLSSHRGELMGVAMLCIILFHTPLPRGDAFYGLARCGNVGVDIFLFLSGIGLWHAWQRQPSAAHFYRRRMLRLLPAWLIMASLYYIPRFDWQTGSLIDLIGDITINWDFWLHDELTFWYVPAIMMLYLWAPLYLRLITRYDSVRWLPVLMIVWCVAVQWISPIHHAVGHIEIFWSRIPIFLIGINCGELVMKQRRMEPAAHWMLLLTLMATAAVCIYLEQMKHGYFPLFTERMVYIPLTVSFTLLLAHALEHAPCWLRRCMAFVGAISLEIYLIHLHFVIIYITPLHWDYWPTALLTIAISIPLAWLLRLIIKRILPI